MDCRDETFTYNTPATDLPDLVADPGMPSGSDDRAHLPHRPRAGAVHAATASRSRAATRSGVASWRRSSASSALNDARNVERGRPAMSEVTWNENVIAADSDGNIGYWHPGLHPLRPQALGRAPAVSRATGAAEWSGLLPAAKTPQVINPKQGWLANWNNPPSIGWTNGDGDGARAAQRTASTGSASSRRWSRGRSQARASSARPRSCAPRAPRRSSFPFVDRRRLRQATKQRRRRRRRDSAARCARGTATTRPWTRPARSTRASRSGRSSRIGSRRSRCGAVGAGGVELAGATGLSHQFDITNGEALALRTLKTRHYARAARKTASGAQRTLRHPRPRRLARAAAHVRGHRRRAPARRPTCRSSTAAPGSSRSRSGADASASIGSRDEALHLLEDGSRRRGPEAIRAPTPTTR